MAINRIFLFSLNKIDHHNLIFLVKISQINITMLDHKIIDNERLVYARIFFSLQYSIHISYVTLKDLFGFVLQVSL